MDIKRLTDDREFLIKELEKQYTEQENPTDIKPSKYDEGTGTYYADEELARKKLEAKKVIIQEKEEKPERTLDELLALMVEPKDNKPAKKKIVTAMKESDGSKWHTRR